MRDEVGLDVCLASFRLRCASIDAGLRLRLRLRRVVANGFARNACRHVCITPESKAMLDRLNRS